MIVNVQLIVCYPWKDGRGEWEYQDVIVGIKEDDNWEEDQWEEEAFEEAKLRITGDTAYIGLVGLTILDQEETTFVDDAIYVEDELTEEDRNDN